MVKKMRMQNSRVLIKNAILVDGGNVWQQFEYYYLFIYFYY